MSLSMNIKILTMPYRKDPESPYRFTGILDNDIYAITQYTDVVSHLLKPGNFVMLRNFNKNTQESGSLSLRLSTRTKVYEVKPFPTNQQVEGEFFHAPTIELGAIKQSPPKRRCSVEADVTEVYEMRRGPKWSRRDVKLTDPKTAHSVTLKLWNEKAEVDVAIGDKVIIENVEVSTFKDVTSLSSTTETDVQIQSQQATKTVVIMGIEILDDHVNVATLHDDLTIQQPLLERYLGPAQDVLGMTPLKLVVVVDGADIVDIIQPDGAEAPTTEPTTEPAKMTFA